MTPKAPPSPSLAMCIILATQHLPIWYVCLYRCSDYIKFIHSTLNYNQKKAILACSFTRQYISLTLKTVHSYSSVTVQPSTYTSIINSTSSTNTVTSKTTSLNIVLSYCQPYKCTSPLSFGNILTVLVCHLHKEPHNAIYHQHPIVTIFIYCSTEQN